MVLSGQYSTTARPFEPALVLAALAPAPTVTDAYRAGSLLDAGVVTVPWALVTKSTSAPEHLELDA